MKAWIVFSLSFLWALPARSEIVCYSNPEGSMGIETSDRTAAGVEVGVFYLHSRGAEGHPALRGREILREESRDWLPFVRENVASGLIAWTERSAEGEVLAECRGTLSIEFLEDGVALQLRPASKLETVCTSLSRFELPVGACG